MYRSRGQQHGDRRLGGGDTAIAENEEGRPFRDGILNPPTEIFESATQALTSLRNLEEGRKGPRLKARALELARDEVRAFSAALLRGLPAEVAATHVRSAETALEDLLGVVSVDDILDAVFQEFCIGK